MFGCFFLLLMSFNYTNTLESGDKSDLFLQKPPFIVIPGNRTFSISSAFGPKPPFLWNILPESNMASVRLPLRNQLALHNYLNFTLFLHFLFNRNYLTTINIFIWKMRNMCWHADEIQVKRLSSQVSGTYKLLVSGILRRHLNLIVSRSSKEHLWKFG